MIKCCMVNRITLVIVLFSCICALGLTSHASNSLGEASARAAKSQIGRTTSYNSAYVKLDYPNGDVDISTGVCTDVVIRALRASGIDLQQLIHEDMQDNFSSYPNMWDLKKPDRNIDHRRVPNIIKYFERQGKVLQLPLKSANVQGGDLIAWILPNNMYHIAVVESVKRKNIYIVHNIGVGAKLEKVPNDWKTVAHIRP